MKQRTKDLLDVVLSLQFSKHKEMPNILNTLLDIQKIYGDTFEDFLDNNIDTIIQSTINTIGLINMFCNCTINLTLLKNYFRINILQQIIENKTLTEECLRYLMPHILEEEKNYLFYIIKYSNRHPLLSKEFVDMLKTFQ